MFSMWEMIAQFYVSVIILNVIDEKEKYAIFKIQVFCSHYILVYRWHHLK